MPICLVSVIYIIVLYIEATTYAGMQLSFDSHKIVTDVEMAGLGYLSLPSQHNHDHNVSLAAAAAANPAELIPFAHVHL